MLVPLEHIRMYNGYILREPLPLPPQWSGLNLLIHKVKVFINPVDGFYPYWSRLREGKYLVLFIFHVTSL